MKRFCIGDIHGGYLALLQVLERSKFNYKKDLLISLGDVADGWPQVSECFDELLKIKNLVYIIGNHDEWLYQWFLVGSHPYIWTSQGGQATIDNYVERFKKEGTDFSKAHQKLLQYAYNYYVLDNKCFVHGGFNCHHPIQGQSRHDLIWDRHLFDVAKYWNKIIKHGIKDPENFKVKEFDEVFIGHTSTSWTDPSLKPVHVSNVWNLDQGAGWEGKLTLMDIDSKEYWQSDIVKLLYPNVKGR